MVNLNRQVSRIMISVNRWFRACSNASLFQRKTSKIFVIPQRKFYKMRAMLRRCAHLLPSAETYTDSFTIWRSCLILVVRYRRITICLWVTTLIVGTTRSRRLRFSSALKFDTPSVSRFCVETTRASRSLRSMASMMSASGNTEMQTCGNILLHSSTICLSLRWSRAVFSAYTAASPPVSTHLIRSSSSIGSWRCLMKDPSAISFGPTQMIDAAGVYLREVLDIPSDRTFLNNSTTRTILSWSQEHISS